MEYVDKDRKKDIVIVAQYLCDLDHLDESNGRFVYLAKCLAQNHNVEIITSTFIHGIQKQTVKGAMEYENIKIKPLYEPGYPRNVCLKRFQSHSVLAKNVERYLNERKKPDVIYAAVPSLSVAEVAAKYCEKKKVRFVVDIQDLWPEAFKMVFHVPIISDFIFLPLKKQADRIYRTADEIVAVSKTYAERGMRVNKKCKSPTVVFLGTELETFDEYAKKSMADKFEGITVGYIGSMSASYDLISVIDAIAMLNCDVPVKLLAMGEGVEHQKFEEYASKKSINAEFTGRLSYPEMVERLITCDIAVNPIHKVSAGSIINKVGDYAMTGLPVVNTQKSPEYRELLDTYHAGINCECENAQDVANAIMSLINDEKLRADMAINSRRLGEERFNRSHAYAGIVNKLLTNRGGIRIAYCGTLGHSYDITCIIDAIRSLDSETQSKVEFIVLGDGPRKDEFVKASEDLPVIFTGRVPYPDMVWVLSRCDIAVNPITRGAAQSIINKHGDYAASGLPVINTQENLEYRELVEKYEMGFNCSNGDYQDVAKKLRQLIDNKELRAEMGKNARRCAEEKFDRKHSYKLLGEVLIM